MESSETFDTWTLVTNKETDSPNTPASSTSLNTDSDIDNRIEILQEDHNNNDKAEEAENVQDQHLQIVEKSLEPLNSNTDDLSDGISIISGSESPGRLSPHPDLRDHLQDFNLKFATHNDFVLNDFKPCMDTVSGVEILPIANAEQDLRQRGKISTSISGKEIKALQKASQTANTAPANEDTPPRLKRGLHGIFYVGVVLVDEQKKQRKSDKKSPAYEQEQQQQPQQHKRKPSFKAWPGIGDVIKPMDGTKEDLKRPHKCTDGSYVELAGMCVEKSSSNEPTIPEQLGHNINNLRKHSNLIEDLEEMSEKTREFIHNPYDKLEEVIKDNWKMRKEETKGKTDLKRSSDHGHKEKNYNPLDYSNENNKHSKTREYQNSSNNYGKIQQQQQQQQQEVRYDKSKDYIKGRKFRDDDKSQQERKRNYNSKEKNTPINSSKSQQQQQQQHDKHRNNSKERKPYNNDIDKGEVLNYDSKERSKNYRKTQQYDKQYKDNSKERKSYNSEKERKEKFNYNSKEGKNGRRSYDSKEEYAQERYGKEAKRKGNDGIWHLNYMKNRETARQEKEHKIDKDKNKNWFIERANSREMKRVSEGTRLR
ncbi:peptidyl-prolyl cis-trans isomerase G [Glossina fuscipes]|uniref:Peptidyl-prolyl cis-trans isomerase G n=1 Tax=Glossina fuscipes TaxID=7396 RepID=A0A9C6DTY9_9MUSC|nr:peptidyl-prolyl cis-trans isomerase G [Glossina fuscipes]